MSETRTPLDQQTLRRLAVGGAAAALMGCGAGQTLKPRPLEWVNPTAPQQLYVAQLELAALELAGGGWPARRPS